MKYEVVYYDSVFESYRVETIPNFVVDVSDYVLTRCRFLNMFAMIFLDNGYGFEFVSGIFRY